MGPEDAAATCSAILDEVERAVVGRTKLLTTVPTPKTDPAARADGQDRARAAAR